MNDIPSRAIVQRKSNPASSTSNRLNFCTFAFDGIKLSVTLPSGSITDGPSASSSHLPNVNQDNPDQVRWYEEQVLPFAPNLRAYLVGRYPSLPDVENLVQESLIKVFRAYEKVAIKSPRALLFSIARNMALDVLRRQQLVSFEPITEINDSFVLSDELSVIDFINKKQEFELLEKAIQNLPERCRQVMTLRTVYGLSQKAIAAEMSISENTVEKQMTKGVRRCAAFFARYGLP